MEASRITFTKETKDKMEKGLNANERGRLRWEKLEEIYNERGLQDFKNRTEIAMAVGFTPEQKTRGYGWVTNMISRGFLTEVAMGVNRYGKMEYQYFLTSLKPDYKHGGKKGKNAQVTKHIEVEKPVAPVILSRASTERSEAKITITKGDIVIAINEIDYNVLAKMVLDILKDVANK